MKKQALALGGTVAAMLCAVSTHVPAAVITYSDATFLNSSWEVGFHDNPLNAFVYVGSGEQSGTGGNPGAYRTTRSFMQAKGILVVTHNYLTAYNPAAGAILSLDYAFDAKNVSTLQMAITYVPAIIQVGSNNERHAYYNFDSALIIGNDGRWYSGSWSGLACGDFDRVNRGSDPNLYPPALLATHPDCSTTGGTLYFGFATYNYNNADNFQPLFTGGVDNWNVTITNDVAAAQTPAPGTLALVALACAGLAVRRRAQAAAR